MSEIRNSQNVTIQNPKVRAVVKRVSALFYLAAEKAVASQADPARYPLPAGSGSIERLLLKRFVRLPKDRRTTAISKVMQSVQAAAATRKAAYGDMASVDLQSKSAVRDQVRKLRFPTSLRLTSSDIGATTHRGSTPIASSTYYAPMSHLSLRLHKVKCNDDTSEIGKDEISLGGTLIDATGNTTRLSAFKIGEFKDGTVKEYSSPRSLATFDLDKGTSWPKTYYATLVLAETDMGGLSDFLNELLDAVDDEVKTALAAAIGAAIGASGGPVTALIGAAVGVVVSEVFSLLKSVWGDDIFEPVTLASEIDSKTDRWSGQTDSPNATVKFSDHGGTYSLTYDWKLS